MPRYTFECKECGLMELDLSMKDSMLSICPKCGSNVFRRIIGGADMSISINVKGGTPIHYPKGKER